MTKCEDCRFAVQSVYGLECRVNHPMLLAMTMSQRELDESVDDYCHGAVWPVVRRGDQCGRGEPKAVMPRFIEGKMVYDEASGALGWLGKDGVLSPIAVEIEKKL